MAVTEATLRSTLRVLRIVCPSRSACGEPLDMDYAVSITLRFKVHLLACVILSASISMYPNYIQVLLGGGDGGNRSSASFNASRSSHLYVRLAPPMANRSTWTMRFRLPCVLKFTYLRALYFLLQYLCTQITFECCLVVEMAVTEATLRSTLRVLRIYMSVSLRLWRTARHGLERFRLPFSIENGVTG